MSRELIVERRTLLAVPPEAAFAWHARPGALARLTPPWMKVQVLQRDPALVEGSRARLLIYLGPLAIHWTAEHRHVEPGVGLDDVQIRGPFAEWVHQHRFVPAGAGRSELQDSIRCSLPRGSGVLKRRVRSELERVLTYRHAVTAADLAMHATAKGKRFHVAVTGASGLIASLLIPLLTSGGHRVTRLVRRAARAGEIRWDPSPGGAGLDPAALQGIDAVVNLAGANIARRWTLRGMHAIHESRETSTHVLAEAMARATNGPRVLLSASAIGYYGDRDEELLTEHSHAGQGFLPQVATAWEAATRPAETAGVRVVRIRIGLPLTPKGGALQRILRPFRLGLGGRLGSGRQWMSWISADDLLGAFHHALVTESVRGPLNAVAPEAVRNAEFTRVLGEVLHRPTRLVVPASVLRLRFGQMADEAILASTRVLPEQLERTGYQFRHRTLTAALEHELGKPAR